MPWYRYAKAVVLLAVVWSSWWAIIGGTLGLYYGLKEKQLGFDIGPTGLEIMIPFGVVGGINGAFFAVALALGEARRSVDALTWGRILLWGALSAVVLPTLIMITEAWRGYRWNDPSLLAVTALAGIAGATSAAATLWLARRGAQSRVPDVAA